MTNTTTSFGYIIRLSRGEEIIGTLEQFCRDTGVTGGYFFGLGAVSSALIGMYSMDTFEYTFKEFPDPHEITNLVGNIALHGEDVLIHAHITLADAEQRAFGGHLKEALVEPTCEVALFTTDTIRRTFDEDSRLPLLNLSVEPEEPTQEK